MICRGNRCDTLISFRPTEPEYHKESQSASYAQDLAQRVAALSPKAVLETAAGSGVVTSPDALAQIVKELAPKTEVQIVGASGTDGKQAPLDLSTSKAELGYTPQFPLKKALQDYMEALWSEGKIVA